MSQSYPDKPAPTNHDIHPLIAKRWSPLAFSSEPISEEQVMSLFEAMRWAPSSFNGQPWRVITATQDDPEVFKQLGSLLVEGNAWAKNAFLLMVICAQKRFEYNDKPNKHHAYDTGAAIENLFLQAVSMDLVAHEMAGFDVDRAYELLNIPEEDIEVMTMMAVGKPGDPKELDEDQQKRENNNRERKPLEELVFKGHWPKG